MRMSNGESWQERLGRRSAPNDALFILAPSLTLVLLYWVRHAFAIDFVNQYWVVGQRLLTGGTGAYNWTHAQISSGANAFPYPALSALLFVPFALLPKAVASWIWVGAQMASVLATLRILSVKDRRLYALAFLWWPVIGGWETGNMTLLLGFLLALAWRYRDRPVVSGLLCAVMISLKPFVWPVGLWFLATRRYKAAGWALASGLALNLIAWGAIGFDQVSRYLHLDSAVTTALYRDGYGVISVAVRLGASRSVGTAVLIVIAVALGLLCVWLGRRWREQAALLIAVDLMLVASPLLWNHYFAILIVPLAILRPRLSREWLLPLVLWVCPGGLQEAAWQALLFLPITAALTCLLLRPTPSVPSQVPSPASQERGTSQAHVLATAQGGERAG
jgi:hypothetical protein